MKLKVIEISLIAWLVSSFKDLCIVAETGM